MMFKIQNNDGPLCLKELFRSKHLTYNLRQRESQLFLLKPRTEYLKKAFVYDGAKLWNKLPNYIRYQRNLSSFKWELSSFKP